MLNKLSTILMHEDAITDDAQTTIKSVQVMSNPLTPRLSLIQSADAVLSPEDRCALVDKLQSVNFSDDMPMEEKEEVLLNACTN